MKIQFELWKNYCLEDVHPLYLVILNPLGMDTHLLFLIHIQLPRFQVHSDTVKISNLTDIYRSSLHCEARGSSAVETAIF